MYTVIYIIYILKTQLLYGGLVVCLCVCVFVCVCPELIEKTILPREQKFRK